VAKAAILVLLDKADIYLAVTATRATIRQPKKDIQKKPFEHQN